MDETTMVDAARRGDLTAFNELMLSHQNSLFSMALRVLGDEDSAADVMQETLLSAFRKLNTFRGGPIKYWLARIAINACYDVLRRKRRCRTAPLEQMDANAEEMEPGLWMADPTAGPEESCEVHELEQAIMVCLQSLSPAYRVVLVLVDIEGRSYEEAAAVMGIPVNTVKSRLSRARLSMRAELQQFRDQLPTRYRVGFSQQVEAYR